MRTKTSILAVLSILALIATSCASKKDTGFPAETPAPKTTDEATGAPTGPVPLSGPIDVVDNKFEPLEVEVKAGEKIEWEVTGTAPHSITFSSLPYDEPAGCEISDVNKCTPEAGTEFDHTIAKAGRYHYYCKIHGSANAEGATMYGFIVVT